jgi:hypothetical protein
MKRSLRLRVACALVLLVPAVLFVHLARTGEKKAVAEGRFNGHIVLPSDSRSAHRYLATKLSLLGPGGISNKSNVRLEFAVHRSGEDEVLVTVQRLEAEVIRNSRPVELKTKTMAGKTFRFKMNAAGPKRFKLTTKKHATPEAEAVSEMLRDDILPLLLPLLPKNFKLEAGFSWGKKAGRDSLKDFTSHPRCAAWSVARVLQLGKKCTIAHLTSYTEDKLDRPEEEAAVAWRETGISYDAIFKKVRYARDSSTCLLGVNGKGSPKKTQHSVLTICEVAR